MVFLTGAAIGIKHAAATMAPHTTEFDGAAFGMGSFMGTRANKANQDFERKIEAFNFKMKKQKLHREDIKDLIELTTARMHIYQLVGTLLLAFSMGWYTDSTVWHLPVWYSSLFLISNYAAVGYLILCVWLAMYAAVASRSVGTRLLTSYTRISFPTKKELDDVKVDIISRPAGVLQSMKGAFLGKSELEEEVGMKEDMQVSEDDTQHFKRFLDELPRWLVYDTWARVCMTYGMNQLLQALSYFSMATIWPKSPMAAIVSFITLNNLALILLWLDLGELDQSWWDLFMIVFCSFLPASLAVVLLLQEANMGPNANSFLVIVCFASHGIWLWYLNNVFQTAGSTNGRFQPGNYANVLEWVRPNVNCAGEELPTEVKEHSNGKFSRQRSPTHALSSKLMPDDDDIHETQSASAFSEDAHLQKACPSKREMNGGRVPGVWLAPKPEESPLPRNVWLPVKVVKLFTFSTVLWWVLGGCMHAAVIELDENHRLHRFTGNENVVPLTPHLLQFPQPCKLFKVAGLHCSPSQLWVSNGFSTFASFPETTASNLLTLVKDANVGAVICGHNHCSALSPPDDEGSWLLTSMEDTSGNRTSKSTASVPVPIPQSWRVLSGTWSKCSSESGGDCTSAWIAGWDGAKVYVASMQKDESTNAWSVHTQFDVDPANGCSDASSGCERGENYTDVQSLEMSEGGSTLLILLGNGVIDVWDLSKGVVRESLHVGQGFTSMCQNQKSIFLSREESDGPVVDKIALSPRIALMMQPKVLSFASLGSRQSVPTSTPVKHHSPLASKLRGVHAVLGSS